MRNKSIFTACMALLLSLATAAQTKKQPQTLTLTNGRYSESFDEDSIQRIGSALININTMQIVKLQLTKEEEKLFDNTHAGRFLSVDPLADSYPFYTPYQYASNNPVAYIDLDGKEGLLSIFLPNPYSAENTALLKNKLGVKQGSFADKAIDFIAGAGDRSLQLNNPATYVTSAGDHLKNMYNNAKAIVTSPTAEGKVDAALHLSFPSLNQAENAGQQAATAIQTGDTRTMGAFFTDAAMFAISLKAGKVSGVSENNLKVDLMGGEKTRLGTGWINYDLKAIEGIKADVADFNKFFKKSSVSEITVNNPQADFLKNITDALKNGGSITIRGGMSNKYFNKVWNGSAEGLDGFEIIKKTENVPNSGYFQNDGVTPVNGVVNEIILKKKS